MKEYQFELTSQSPATLTEEFIVKSIWYKNFPVGSNLPSERELAEKIGVTRTTLREVLQRLARDGWLTIQHGKPSKVNEIWQTASPSIISTLINLDINLLPIIVDNVVTLRTQMGGRYIPEAITKFNSKAQEVFDKLEIPNLEDSPAVYAQFDYELYRSFAFAAEKPVYGLILNSFKNIYLKVATFFFSHSQARQSTQAFYQNLKELCLEQDSLGAFKLLEDNARHNQKLWKSIQDNISIEQLKI